MGITPMMQQYFEIKEQYKDCILFFRLGDFYEMFFDDAETASKVLEITLTGRDCGLEKRAPMCGVPFHSADSYIAKLVQNGFKVAICEQIEDPALAKGIVKRDVIKVVTPGTVTDTSMLEDRKNNYLMGIFQKGTYFGIAVVDVTTGDFNCTAITWGNTAAKLIDEIARVNPSEILANSEFYHSTDLLPFIRKRFGIYVSTISDTYFEYENANNLLLSHFGEIDICEDEKYLTVNASGALLEYLNQTQKVSLGHIRTITSYKIEEFMVLDIATRRNLELVETMRDKNRKGSLLWVLDKTVTAMGGRQLRRWVEQPLIRVSDIQYRLNAVNEFKEKFMIRSELRELLKRIYDLERLMGKVILGNVNGRDLIALKSSMQQLPYIKELLSNCSSQMLIDCNNKADILDDVCSLIDNAIDEQPPVTIKEGGIIKDGFNDEVDKLRAATKNGKNWIADIETSEREKTGIKNLKVGFNKVFGYYIEVTKSNISNVPDYFIRKQTLANCERYITPELKELEETILGAEEKVIQLEYELFVEVREKIAAEVGRIKATAASIASIDSLCSLAEVADRENYCMPEVNNSDVIEIIEGRHPVVEKMLDSESFVPNDTLLNMQDGMVSIITGPNMAGKSTYMRQVALIVLMAQIGSFIPATKAKIGITDRIFTRVGASDDLASGQSTFMVEMTEVANILNNATPKSLLILDEIGRGTSTYDGLSIAWAVLEFISDPKRLGCRTLFATHYHELTDLENNIEGIKNYCISVMEKGEDIIFLRKIIPGGADDSYGVQVARLAGVPHPVIERANEILKELEEADISKQARRARRAKKPMNGQLGLFSFTGDTGRGDEILKELESMDIGRLTPLDALNTLYQMQQKLRKG